jgi:outer membrane protein assembly factor BamE (lipoprotein component of BamABCDE complex)
MFLTVFLSNCQKNRVIKTHGIFYLQNRTILLKVQNSNRNDVIKILGKPHSKSLHEQNTWIYIERTRTKGKLLKLGRNVLLNNNVLVLKFDKYGILEEKLFYDKTKMNEYKFVKAETKNTVKRGSFVKSFVNSLRQKMRANAKK